MIAKSGGVEEGYSKKVWVGMCHPGFQKGLQNWFIYLLFIYLFAWNWGTLRKDQFLIFAKNCFSGAET